MDQHGIELAEVMTEESEEPKEAEESDEKIIDSSASSESSVSSDSYFCISFILATMSTKEWMVISFFTK